MKQARGVRTIATIVTLAIAVAGLAGCGARGAGPTASTETTASPAGGGLGAFPLTVTDDAGREVRFTGPPARVVSLAPANTEIVHALGLFDRLVGVTTYDDYPAQVKDVPKVGDFAAPNIEAVTAAAPDVVLVTGGVQADVISKLESAGARVLVVDPKNVDGVYAAITMVAKVLGVPEKGDEVVAGMRADLADIAKRVGTSAAKRAFIEIGWNPLFTAGRGTLLDDLLTRAGGVNVVTQKDYVAYSVEQLVKDQPDVYLGTLTSLGDAAAIGSRPGYASLRAVKTGAVHSLDDNLVSRPGPRVVEGVREIAKALHPDAFK